MQEIIYRQQRFFRFEKRKKQKQKHTSSQIAYDKLSVNDLYNAFNSNVELYFFYFLYFIIEKWRFLNELSSNSWDSINMGCTLY